MLLFTRRVYDRICYVNINVCNFNNLEQYRIKTFHNRTKYLETNNNSKKE